MLLGCSGGSIAPMETAGWEILSTSASAHSVASNPVNDQAFVSIPGYGVAVFASTASGDSHKTHKTHRFGVH